MPVTLNLPGSTNWFKWPSETPSAPCWIVYTTLYGSPEHDAKGDHWVELDIGHWPSCKEDMDSHSLYWMPLHPAHVGMLFQAKKEYKTQTLDEFGEDYYGPGKGLVVPPSDVSWVDGFEQYVPEHKVTLLPEGDSFSVGQVKPVTWLQKSESYEKKTSLPIKVFNWKPKEKGYPGIEIFLDKISTHAEYEEYMFYVNLFDVHSHTMVIKAYEPLLSNNLSTLSLFKFKVYMQEMEESLLSNQKKVRFSMGLSYGFQELGPFEIILNMTPEAFKGHPIWDMIKPEGVKLTSHG